MAQADTTLLFTDIEGSTRILGQVGEATYGEVLELHHELIRSAISRHSGQELGTEGDSFFVHESVRIYRGQGDAGGLAHAYVEAAQLHSGDGEHDRAIQLLAAADAARSRIGIVTPGSEAGPISKARAAATVALGAEIAARHAALGLTLTVDEAVALI